jgi:putative transposase
MKTLCLILTLRRTYIVSSRQKERQNSIADELRPKLWAYLNGIAQNLKLVPIAIDGTSNHAHLLLRVPPLISLSEAIQKLKANSSRWMGEHKPFEWQEGYAAFSVSPSSVDKVKNYVQRQQEHHRTHTFEEEIFALLDKAGIPHNIEEVLAA